ncbi:hypothetical protein COB72_10285 [bacterium]|nr:MAG: hypothetical protein COB72_10285 [bacterium]
MSKFSGYKPGAISITSPSTPELIAAVMVIKSKSMRLGPTVSVAAPEADVNADIARIEARRGVNSAFERLMFMIGSLVLSC